MPATDENASAGESPERTGEQLRTLYEIHEAAQAANEAGMYALDQTTSTYSHLRDRARQVHVARGRSGEEFDAAIPPWTENSAAWASRFEQLTGGSGGGPREMMERSSRVQQLLGQLTAWTTANIGAVEVERQQRIEADAKMSEAAEARIATVERAAQAAEQRADEAEARASAAEALLAERRRRNWKVLIGLTLIVVGVAIGVSLPLTALTGGWGLAVAVIAAISLVLLGVRVLIGAKLGGQLVLWVSLIVGMVSVAAVIIASTAGKH